MRFFSTAILVLLTASGCASKNIAPKVVTPPTSPEAPAPVETMITYQAVGTHQTLIKAERPFSTTLVSISLLGTNGELDLGEVEQTEPGTRWQFVLNTAPQDIDTLTLVFKNEDNTINVSRLTPNR